MNGKGFVGVDAGRRIYSSFDWDLPDVDPPSWPPADEGEVGAVENGVLSELPASASARLYR